MADPASPAALAPALPDSSLKTRVRSAIVLGIVVLGAVYFGGIPFALLMGLAAAISVYEWGKMVFSGQHWRLPLMLFGMFYIGLSVWMMIWLRVSPHGLYNILTLLLIVWASDISAYFTGKAIGGPRLAPAISPKKTWAGFFGSSAGSALVAAALASPAALSWFGAETIGHMTWAGYAAMGFVLAMFGQAGDLFISILKRRYGVKDTGTIIPGHGGILDRIDALLLVSLLFGCIVIYFI